MQRTVFRDYIGLANAAYNTSSATTDNDWTLSNLVEEVRRKVLHRVPPPASQVVAAAVTSIEKPAVIEELIFPAPQHSAPPVQSIQEEPLPQADQELPPSEKAEEEQPAAMASPQTGESNLAKRPPEGDSKQQAAVQEQEVKQAE